MFQDMRPLPRRDRARLIAPGDQNGADMPDFPEENNQETRLDPETAAAIDDTAEAMAAPPPDDGDGPIVRARRVITTRDFLPGRDPQWAIANVAARPRGFQMLLGHLFGYATGFERQTNEVKGAGGVKTLESVLLKGNFEATVVDPETGEITEIINAGNAYLPLAYAEPIGAAFVAGAARIILDLSLGLEATGKMIPYEWVVKGPARADDPTMNALRSRQQARLGKQRAAGAIQIGSPGQKALSGF